MIVEYDGTNYHGSQKQPGLPTIQGMLEEAMLQINLGGELTFASRTDAGVHATGQVINLLTRNQIPLKNIPLALNAGLPQDIKIRKAEEAALDFNARRQAKSRAYIYSLYFGKELPVFLRKYVYKVDYSLEIDSMQKAAGYLLGEHDFTSFSSSDTEEENFIRQVFEVRLLERALETPFNTSNRKSVSLFIKANSFLNKMVRAIVGALIDVGRGKLKPEEVKKILEAKDRFLASPFAPAHGLCLTEVEY